MNSENGLTKLEISKDTFKDYFEQCLRAHGFILDNQEVAELDVGVGDIIPFKLRTIKEERMVSKTLDAQVKT